jgi:hypothetical protein
MQTTFMCPYCKKDHMVREIAAWAPDTDHAMIQIEIEDADFYDTEALNSQTHVKAQLEEEYERAVDFVLERYSGWCLRPEAAL